MYILAKMLGHFFLPLIPPNFCLKKQSFPNQNLPPPQKKMNIAHQEN